MTLPEVTNRHLGYYLTFLFLKWSHVSFTTTQLCERIIQHYEVARWEKHELDLLKKRVRTQLKHMVKARIVQRYKHQTALKTTEYRYKLREDVA